MEDSDALVYVIGIVLTQAGVGTLEAAFTPACAPAVPVKLLCTHVVGGLASWTLAYGLSFGASPALGGFCGWGGWAPEPHVVDAATRRDVLLALYVVMTAVNVASGCAAGRLRLCAHLALCVLAPLVLACPVHWVWAKDGWLATRGVLDVCGAAPIHVAGACAGLVTALVAGPRRRGVYGPAAAGGGRTMPTTCSPGGVVVGTMTLCIGTFIHMTLTVNRNDVYTVKPISVLLVSFIASNVGGLVGMIASFVLHGRRLSVVHVAQGVLAGLVSLSACCGVVSGWEACLVALVGAALSLCGRHALARAGVDDPAGFVSTFGVPGFCSLLTVGFFSKEDRINTHNEDIEQNFYKGIFQGGSWGLLGVQAAAAAAAAGWSLVLAGGLMMVLHAALGGLRGSESGGAGLDQDSPVEKKVHFASDLAGPGFHKRTTFPSDQALQHYDFGSLSSLPADYDVSQSDSCCSDGIFLPVRKLLSRGKSDARRQKANVATIYDGRYLDGREDGEEEGEFSPYGPPIEDDPVQASFFSNLHSRLRQGVAAADPDDTAGSSLPARGGCSATVALARSYLRRGHDDVMMVPAAPDQPEVAVSYL